MRYYIGTYTHLGGPGACIIEADNNRLSLISSCGAIGDPGYLIKASDGVTLYAGASVDSGAKGAVGSFRVSGDALIPLSLQPTGGSSACHVCLSADEQFLYATNYITGNISVFPVAQGYIMPRVQLIRHTGGSRAYQDRQDSAHPHQAVFRPASNELFICDLGLDEVVVYLQDEETGLLIRKESIKAAPGCGPRHLLFDGPDRFYLACELSNEVMTFQCDGGVWRCAQTLSTLPNGFAGESAVAAIRRMGKHIFVSNRGYDSIAKYQISADGKLSMVEIIKVQGSFPRDICPVSENSILAANQFGNTVEWIVNGKTVSTVSIVGAICILPA